MVYYLFNCVLEPAQNIFANCTAPGTRTAGLQHPKEELLNLQNHDELLAEDRLRLDNDSMKKELDFWTKSTTIGARDWCDRLRQAEQKFREAAEKNARLEEALRDLNSKLDQLALMTNCARAVCFEAKAASASA